MAMKINVTMTGKSKRHYWLGTNGFGSEYIWHGSFSDFYNQVMLREILIEKYRK